MMHAAACNDIWQFQPDVFVWLTTHQHTQFKNLPDQKIIASNLYYSWRTCTTHLVNDAFLNPQDFLAEARRVDTPYIELCDFLVFCLLQCFSTESCKTKHLQTKCDIQETCYKMSIYRVGWLLDEMSRLPSTHMKLMDPKKPAKSTPKPNMPQRFFLLYEVMPCSFGGLMALVSRRQRFVGPFVV